MRDRLEQEELVDAVLTQVTYISDGPKLRILDNEGLKPRPLPFRQVWIDGSDQLTAVPCIRLAKAKPPGITEKEF